MRLRGKVLKQDQNAYDSDYSGGSVYSQRSIAVYLYEDKSFIYREKRFSSVTAGDFSLPSESVSDQEGQWNVEARSESVCLVLFVDGDVYKTWTVEDGGVGVEYLDGVAWRRYVIGN